MLDDISSDSLAHLLTSTTENHIGAIHHCISLNRRDVVEIQGPPSSGKTHLMYLFLITCITPSEYHSVTLGGWDKAAIVFDMDGAFDVTRFSRLLLGRLNRLCSFDANVSQTLAQRSLEKLHIFRPSSSTQLATTLAQLGLYHAAHLPRADIGLVAIDSINAYHWPDRLSAEHMRTSSLSPEIRKASNLTLPPLCILTALSSFCATYAPVVVMTSRGIQPILHGVLALGDPLISTHHITLSTLTMPRFQQHMPIGTLNAEEKRLQREGVERVDILALMRMSKSSTVDTFTVRITGDEVLLQ